MSGSIELARAYVQIVPSMQGVQSKIASEFGGIGDKQGARVGTEFAGGLRHSIAGGAVAGIVGGVVGAVTTSAVGAVKSAVSVAGSALQKGLDRAISIQNAEKKLEGLGHSAKSISTIMGNALSAVKGTAFGLGDAATIAASAVAAGVKPGKNLAAYLKLTADTATIAGTDLGTMGSILNKVTASGTVYTDTLNQLSDRGVPVFQFLAKQYGVTQDRLADMVRDGKVKSADLMKALQKNLGGAALSSGKTAEGAWANVGAALGRLGVLFTGGPVAEAPTLFTQISVSVDAFAKAIKPVADLISGAVVSAMKMLEVRLAKIDWQTFAANIIAVKRAVLDFYGGFTVGTDELGSSQSKFAVWGANAYIIFDRVRDIAVKVGAAISGMLQGKGLNLSGLTGSFAQIRDVLTPMWPLAVKVAQAVGQMAGNLGGLLGPAVGIINPLLKVLTSGLQFVADHMDTVIAFLPVIAAGFVAWRLATTSVLAANRLLTAAQLVALPIQVANNAARIVAARAELQVAAANGMSTGSILANAAATGRQAIATVASRVAMIAGAAATGVATAAQWLFNAALSANPIGIIIVAIAALVAGLIWFFTQTKVGRDAWAAFTGFIVSAWNAVVKWFQGAINAVVGFFQKWGPLILGAVAPVIGLPLLIISHWSEIVAFFSSIGGKIVGFLSGASKWLVETGARLLAGLLAGAKTGLLAVGRWEMGIVHTVVGALAGAGKWLLNTGAAVLTGLRDGAVNGLIAFARWELAIGKTVIGALKGAQTWLLNIGAQVIQGLVNGIRGGFDLVVNAARGLASLLPDWVRKVLGIHSPSKVFATIGRYVGQGLAQGLAGSHDTVVTATQKLTNGITDAFSKLVSERTAAQKKLDSLNKRLANTSTRTKAGRTAAANLRDQIADQKKVVTGLNAASKLTTKQRSAYLATLKTDTSKLATLATRRDQLAAQMKDAQSALADAVKVKTDFAANVQATSIALGSVTDAFAKVFDARKTAADAVADLTSKVTDANASQASAQADVNATRKQISAVDQALQALSGSAAVAGDTITQLQQKRTDLAGNLTVQLTKVSDLADQTAAAQASLADAQAKSVQSSTPTILQTLQQAVADTTTFQAVLAQLKSEGVDDTTYSQLLSAGVANGGLAAAQELASAGAGVVKQVAALQGQLSTAGANLGTATSTVLYQQGVDVAQAVVDGIKAKQVDNQAAIALWETAIADQLKKLGMNTKPLTADAGKQIVAGLTDGIKGSQSDLDKAISALGKSTVTRLKKELGIHSPSRVMREQVGQQVGAGFVLGIEDTHAAAEAAMAGLANVPAAAYGGGFGMPGGAAAGGGVQQNFYGQMGFSKDEVADRIATKARRAIAGVNIPRVSAR